MPRILTFDEIGGTEVLRIREAGRPDPAEGEVRFAVKAMALNRADHLFINGHHYSLPKLPRSRVGSEAAGVVDAVGPGVSQFAVGDSVSSIPFHNYQYGVHGEFAIVPATYLSSYPDNLEVNEATSIWMQYLTAYFALIEISELGSNDFVLITAASSSAGIGAIQVAKSIGACVIATTRTNAKREKLLELGADHVVVTDDENMCERITDLTDGRGVRVVYDPVGGSFVERYIEAVAEEAIVLLYGLLSGEVTPVPIVAMVQRAAILRPYSMFNHVNKPEQLERGKSFVLDGIRSGSLRPIVDRVFQFEEIVDAYRYMESGTQTGKIVIETDN